MSRRDTDPRRLLNWHDCPPAMRWKLAEYCENATLRVPNFIAEFRGYALRHDLHVAIGDLRQRVRQTAFWRHGDDLASIGVEPCHAPGVAHLVPVVAVCRYDFEPPKRTLEELELGDSWPPLANEILAAFALTWDEIESWAPWFAAYADAHRWGWLPPHPPTPIEYETAYGPSAADIREAWTMAARRQFPAWATAPPRLLVGVK